MVVALLAVLKAGAAYLPLDPENPRERLEFILDDAQVSTLISRKSIAGHRRWRYRCDRGTAPNVIWLDGDRRQIEKQSPENLNIKIQPRDLAYVIYTSGSTGMPKGVQIEQRSLVNCLRAMGEQLRLEPKRCLAGGDDDFFRYCRGGDLIAANHRRQTDRCQPGRSARR